MSAFVSILLSVAALVASLSITHWVNDSKTGTLFFGVSLFGLLAGLLLITTRQRIFSHLVGFLIIENAVFLFSLAVGAELPMLVNVGILLDILMGVLMLGLFSLIKILGCPSVRKKLCREHDYGSIVFPDVGIVDPSCSLQMLLCVSYALGELGKDLRGSQLRIGLGYSKEPA